MNRFVEPSTVAGSLKAPSSKSSLQRALACAALAPGVSVLHNPTWSEDSLATAGVAEALGARVERAQGRVTVRGIPAAALSAATPEPLSVSCGESGTCLRMFSAIAALFDREIELAGEGTLARRPVEMVVDSLRSLGVECSTREGLPPVRVRGPLRGGSVRVDASSSSQFLTGLLIALPLTGADSVITVDRLVSRGYVDLTLDVMRAFGARAASNEDYTEFRVPSGCPYRAAEYTVEGDWSGAAFLLVAGALAAREAPLEVRGLDAGSSQPDHAILDALRASGADVDVSAEAVRVRSAPLAAFSFDATDCPDLFPPLAALAAYCEGETLLKGASRLRAKESDRGAALSEEFANLGVRISVEGDEMRVTGRPPARSQKPMSAGGVRVQSRGDHRIAMAAAVAALAAPGPVAIEGAECVSKSWPGFFEALDSVRR